MTQSLLALCYVSPTDFRQGKHRQEYLNYHFLLYVVMARGLRKRSVACF